MENQSLILTTIIIAAVMLLARISYGLTTGKKNKPQFLFALGAFILVLGTYYLYLEYRV